MNLGRKKLYDADTFPLLAEGYARNGLSDKQIMHNLGIGKTAFYDYINIFPDFANAIKRGRTPVDIQVENAMLKRALGYEYEEKTSEVEIFTDALGNANTRPVAIKTTKKHMPADVGAGAFWLKNRKSSVWKDRHQVELEQTRIVVKRK
jgi:hypothetical protein